MASLRLDALRKTYPGGHVAIDRVSLSVGDGEFLVLVGPSGCGKSTLLRAIAGLEALDEGRILIGGVDVTDVPPQSRDLAMVFQSYALYPHMTVRENLEYGLRVRRVERSSAAARVAAVANTLGIGDLLDRRPAQLSGGQRQRVALGRAMVRTPKAFLLDEPLSNLDPGLRAQARAELRRVHRALKATIVYVTHDQEEALTLGDRVAVMRAGIVEQIASPLEIYDKPANAFVARFIGTPPMNFLPAPLAGIDAPAGALAGIRPHDVRLGSSGLVRATVDLVEPRGHDTVVHLTTGEPDRAVLTAVVSGRPPQQGSTTFVTFARERVHLFDAASGARIEC